MYKFIELITFLVTAIQKLTDESVGTPLSFSLAKVVKMGGAIEEKKESRMSAESHMNAKLLLLLFG